MAKSMVETPNGIRAHRDYLLRRLVTEEARNKSLENTLRDLAKALAPFIQFFHEAGFLPKE